MTDRQAPTFVIVIVIIFNIFNYVYIFVDLCDTVREQPAKMCEVAGSISEQQAR